MAFFLPPRTILAPILLFSWLALLGAGVEVDSMLYYERVAGLSFSGFELRLMSSLNDVSGIPTEGKNLIIVAAVNNVLHFRIFDGDVNVVVNTDEKRLAEQARQIEDLRKQLESLWPPHEMTRSEKDRVITAVTSIVGHTPRRSFSSITSGLVFFLMYTPTNAILLFLLAFAARRSLGPPGAEHQDSDRADRADRFLKAVFAIVLTLAILTIARRHLLGFYSQGTYLIAACALSILGWVLGAEGETAERWGGLIPFLTEPLGQHPTEPLGQHPSPVWATTLTNGEVALGFAVLGAWLFVFANGIMIGTIDYFNYINDFNHINNLFIDRESLGKLIMFWIIMFTCYIQTNVGILCCLSGYFGMFFRRVSSISEYSQGRTRSAGGRHETNNYIYKNLTNDYVLATVSGFLVYLVLVSGLVIFGGGTVALRTDREGRGEMVDYAKFAAFASLLSFIEGYKPFLLGPLLQWFKETMSRRIGGDSAQGDVPRGDGGAGAAGSSERPPYSNANAGGRDVSGAPSV